MYSAPLLLPWSGALVRFGHCHAQGDAFLPYSVPSSQGSLQGREAGQGAGTRQQRSGPRQSLRPPGLPRLDTWAQEPGPQHGGGGFVGHRAGGNAGAQAPRLWGLTPALRHLLRDIAGAGAAVVPRALRHHVWQVLPPLQRAASGAGEGAHQRCEGNKERGRGGVAVVRDVEVGCGGCGRIRYGLLSEGRAPFAVSATNRGPTQSCLWGSSLTGMFLSGSPSLVANKPRSSSFHSQDFRNPTSPPPST